MRKKATIEATQNIIISAAERLEDGQNMLQRKIDEVGKTIEATDGDRQLMETHQATLTEVKELVRYARQSIEDMEHDIKLEIKEVNIRVDELDKKMDLLLDQMKDKKIIRIQKKGRFDWLKKLISRKKQRSFNHLSKVEKKLKSKSKK